MFEVLASDLWEVAVNLFPYPLATLSGVSPVKAKRRLAAFVDDGAASPTQGKFIRMDYLQAHGFDLSHRMGTVLRERFNFQVLDGIRDAYYSAFPNESADVRTAIGADALTALAATRNLLVHRSGFVDRRFLEEQARSELLQQLFPAPTPQALLPMSGLAVHNLVQPTIQLGADLLAAIDRFDPAQMRHGAA
ncbi:MAG: hypothetical protein JNK28_15760 [Burkholderiaceae bacterium]|nr:hypothetical protein [Burkholderiaceae bacterium]